MTKQKRWVGVAALAGVTAVAIVAGTIIKKNMNAAPDNAIAITEDGTNAGIQEITTLTDDAGNVTGYNVKVETVGFNSADPIVLAITFNAEADEVTALEVISQSETDGLGAKITEEAFLAQFAGVKLPVYLEGMAPTANETVEEETAPVVEETAEDVVYTDGTYTVVGEEENGYTPEVSVTIADGKITAVSIDAKDADGNLKSVLSEEGVYVMTEDGPTWAAQVQAIADFIVENQGTSAITMDADTKTDAIASVSIKVGGYVNLVNEALNRAAGNAETVELADGTYSVEGEEQGGYTPVASLTVEGGKITAVSIDAKDADGNLKSVLSEEGVYVMTEDGPTWAAQAQAIADFIVENQGTDAITMDADTKTDAIASVSIKVGGYVDLVNELLDQAAGKTTVSAKELADGTYSVEGEEEGGYTPVASLTVEGGKITAVSIDAKDADGNFKSVLSEEGAYVMTENGPTWAAQAEAFAAFVVENQGTDAITLDADTKTDAIASVSIKVGGFVDLVNQLIAEAAGEEVTATEENTTVSAEGTQIDGISGATMSSKAVISAIENARDYLLKAVIK